VAAIANVSVLLFSIRPVAVDMLSVAGELGLLNVTVNPSLEATTVLPLTLIVTICVDWPAVKLNVPLGKAPPVKLGAEAGFVPLPVTA